MNKALDLPEIQTAPSGHICPMGDVPHDKQYCLDKIGELDKTIQHLSLTIGYLYDYKRLLEKEINNKI